VARLLPLAWLALDIVEAILESRPPRALRVKRLRAKVPMGWTSCCAWKPVSVHCRSVGASGLLGIHL